MKKRYIIGILIILIIAISTFNFISTMNNFECEGFIIEIPEGLTRANGYYPNAPPDHIPLVAKDRERWDYNIIDLSEVPLDKLPHNINIVENYTEGDMTIVKGQIRDGVYPNYYDGDNITYAEFNKEGKHFYLVMKHYNKCTLDEINLNDDMKHIKEIKDSIKLK